MLQPLRTFAFYGDLPLHCWHGGEALSLHRLWEGEQKHPKSSGLPSQRPPAELSTTNPPQHIPTEARTRPSLSRVRKIPAPVLSCIPNQPASFQPGKRDQAGATLGLKHPTPFPQENTQDHRKSHSSLWVFWFFLLLHFIYYPVSHSHRISNYRATYSQIF